MHEGERLYYRFGSEISIEGQLLANSKATRSGGGYLSSFADPRGLATRCHDVMRAGWDDQEIVEETKPYSGPTEYPANAKGPWDLHHSSATESFEVTSTPWEEWSWQNDFGALPYTYGSFMQELGGFEAFQDQEAWWDHFRRLPDSEPARDTNSTGGQHSGNISGPDEIQELLDSLWCEEDLHDQSPGVDVLPRSERNIQEVTSN